MIQVFVQNVEKIIVIIHVSILQQMTKTNKSNTIFKFCMFFLRYQPQNITTRKCQQYSNSACFLTILTPTITTRKVVNNSQILHVFFHNNQVYI